MSLSTTNTNSKERNRIRNGYALANCRRPIAVAAPQRPQPNTLSVLPQAVWLHALEFLDFHDILQYRRVDKTTLALLSHTAQSKQALWMPACQRAWPWLDSHSDVRVQGKSTSATSMSNSTAQTSMGIPSFPVLLAMAVNTSNAIDDKRFIEVSSEIKRLCNETVQYTGDIGKNRCVRANVPLSRPTMLQQAKRRLRRFRWRRRWNPFNRNTCFPVDVSVAAWKPFCAPYVLDETAVDLSPRLISYYEVSILDAQKADSLDCVVVGLCTRAFRLSNNMPGWCSASIGYHGDNGGIYHADGTDKVHLYGETFGANDTIGCGIDYQKRQVFFTKNGRFLFYAMGVPEDMIVQDLFPVVGVDTNCLVACNFGTITPFQYDLASLTVQHEHIVAEAIRRKLR